MKKPTRLAFESLEQRQAMAADITAALAANGVLTITSENGDGTITIDRTATQIRLQETNQSFLVSKVKSIAIDLGEDNDTVKVNSLVSRSPWSGTPIRIDSAGGSDRLILNGTAVFFGGDEEDTVAIDKKGNVKIDGAKPTWFDYNVAMDDLGIQARALGVDKVFDRDDMLDLFDTAADNAVLGVDDYNSLRAISNNKSFFKGIEWVHGLSGYVVNANVANAEYQGDPLGNLASTSTGAQLDLLVNKWFLGLDHPAITGNNVEYMEVSGSLFVGAPNYTQVHQGGAEGDCYFLSSMNAIAAHNPEVIENMFVAYDETEGWYTLRFFDKSKPYYVTIDNMLPVVSTTGYLYYDGENLQYNDPSNYLWAAFAEKAYCQLAEFGWTQTTYAENSYAAIDGGNAANVIAQITGQKAEMIHMDEVTEKEVIKAWQKYRPVTFGSHSPSHNPLIVPNHDYALIGYNAQTKEFQLANPWGVTTHPEPATIWLTWDEITTSYEDVHIGSPV